MKKTFYHLDLNPIEKNCAAVYAENQLDGSSLVVKGLY